MYFCPDNKLYCKSCKPDAYEHSFETVTVQDMMKYHSSGVGAASGSGDSGGGGGDIDDSTLMEIDSVEEGGKGARRGLRRHIQQWLCQRRGREEGGYRRVPRARLCLGQRVQHQCR